MKTHKQLPIPETSAWDKKNYDPIVSIYYKMRYEKEKEIPSYLEDYLFDPYFSVTSAIRNFFGFLVRLYKWIPVLWKDRDWDDSYLFQILKHKILSQREYIVKNNRHTNVWQINRDMTICLNLIERILDDHYTTEHFDYLKEEHEFVPTDETNKYYTMNTTTISDNSIEYIKKYFNTAKLILKKYEDLSDYETNFESKKILLIYLSRKRHEKSINLLFYILKNRVENWWD
jgi:hypothetical protein